MPPISKQVGFFLEVKSMKLRKLMVEQRKIADGYGTTYIGSKADFVKAGFPTCHFPLTDQTELFQINGRDAYMQRKSGALQLTLRWDSRGPCYYGAEHPVLSEIARMTLIEMCEWLGAYTMKEVPINKLRKDPRVHYAFPSTARYWFSTASATLFASFQSAAYHAVLSAEIFPVEVILSNAENALKR